MMSRFIDFCHGQPLPNDLLFLPFYNESVPGLLERVVQTIEHHHMLAPGGHVGVAVSGGADSVCLLHLLVALVPRWNLRLTVLHLDHGLRGEESREDAEFVRALAASLGLPVEIRCVELAGTGGNREQAGRVARLQFFREAMANHSLDRVAVGHTRSDQAETVLFRFLRGAGSAGLAAIRPVTPEGILRPLIEIGRDEVRQFLRDRGLPWREDSTNISPQFARNRIRHSLLPLLQAEWNPAIETNLAHTADWALAEEAFWDGEIDRFAAGRLIAQDGRVLVNAVTLRDLPLAAARRMVRRAMQIVKGDLTGIDFPHGEAVLALATRTAGTGGVSIAGIQVRRSFDWLCFTSVTGNPPEISSFRLAADVPSLLRLPAGDLAISLELIENRENFVACDDVYNRVVGSLDWQRLSGPLEMRSWQPGDHYQPVGSATEKKLQALFQESRIPVWERSGWPVLTDSQGIAWTRRFGPATRVALGGATIRILKIREIRNRREAASVYRGRAGEDS
jgi:tRNA(Ile)-lysidine synthase